MVICPNFFSMPQKSELSHLLKTLKDKNLLSQKPSRWNHFCIPFVGLNVPLSYERLKCFRKYIFRLLELRKEKRQSQKELNWNEKHFPGLCSPELIRSSIGSLKSLLGKNSFLVWPNISSQGAYTGVLWSRAIATRIKTIVCHSFKEL